MPEQLSEPEIDERLRGGDWRREGSELVRELKFEDFERAIAFVNRVAQAAEAVNHHPDISVHGYSHVTLRLSTHSAGGITTADLELAERLERLV